MTDGKKKPEKIPEWVKENYCFNTKNIDTTIWNNLVKKIDKSEVLYIIDGKSKTPGFDQITRKNYEVINTE